MDDHNEMYEIGLTAPMEMAEEYRLDEMLPMMGLKIGKRCIILISRSVNAAEILDTLETLRCAEEKLMMVLEDACGRCDSVCEAQALPTDNTEKEMLQKIPDVLMFGLRGRGLCLRQLARHLVKGDTIGFFIQILHCFFYYIVLIRLQISDKFLHDTRAISVHFWSLSVKKPLSHEMSQTY